jgi:hypothetical protein
MADEYDWTIRGSQPRSEEERSKRKIFLGYLDALLEPVDMKSRFATSFWPHDLLPGDQRPPEGAGIEAMEQFRERINTACSTVRSATVTWIEDGAALSMQAGGADPGDLVGASMVVTYVMTAARWCFPVPIGYTSRLARPWYSTSPTPCASTVTA